MMEIKQERLTAFVDILRALVTECRLTMTADGISTMAVDVANVAMVSAVLPKTLFEEYDEKRSEIGMDVEKWHTILAIMNDQKSTIRIRRTEQGFLEVSDGNWSDSHTPLDPDTVRKKPNTPTLNLPASIEVGAKEFYETIKAMSTISDKIRLSTGPDGLSLDVDGDSDKLHKVIPATNGVSPATAVSASFSLDYMKGLARATKDAVTVTVSMGQDHPVRLDFTISGIEASYLLAPRLELETKA